MGPVQRVIIDTLNVAFVGAYIDVTNESHMHSVPAGSESHFKVVLVSYSFAGNRLAQRHQLIYGLLAEQLAGPVHALALHTYTSEEWAEKNGNAPTSPNCLGGSKHD